MDIPDRKSSLPRTVCPSLEPWRHDLHLRHTCTATLSQQVIQENLNHIYHPFTGQRGNYDKLKLRYTKRWTNSMSNELGRLASGVGYRMKSVTETIFFILKHQVTCRKKYTKYSNAVCDYIPLQDHPYCVRLTVGENRIIYIGNTITPY